MALNDQLVRKIITEQELIIGPIAWSEAKKVKGLQVSQDKIRVVGPTRNVIDALVDRYSRLFGEASVEVCKDAAKQFLGKFPASDLPSSLQ